MIEQEIASATLESERDYIIIGANALAERLFGVANKQTIRQVYHIASELPEGQRLPFVFKLGSLLCAWHSAIKRHALASYQPTFQQTEAAAEPGSGIGHNGGPPLEGAAPISEHSKHRRGRDSAEASPSPVQPAKVKTSCQTERDSRRAETEGAQTGRPSALRHRNRRNGQQQVVEKGEAPA